MKHIILVPTFTQYDVKTRQAITSSKQFFCLGTTTAFEPQTLQFGEHACSSMLLVVNEQNLDQTICQLPEMIVARKDKSFITAKFEKLFEQVCAFFLTIRNLTMRKYKF